MLENIDPQAIGERMLEARKKFPTHKFSVIADAVLSPKALGDLPRFNSNFIDHAATRRQELEERAAQGDRFAVALLEGATLAEDPVD